MVSGRKRQCPRCMNPRGEATFAGFSTCGPCRREVEQLAAANRPGAERTYRARKKEMQVRRHVESYGRSVGQHAALQESQAGACAICGDAPSGDGRNGILHIDHDHVTGEVRGLLCSPCNTGIGQLKDDPDILLAAIEYLRRPPAFDVVGRVTRNRTVVSR